jgi:sigma-B regulation protein RsbU (phosphoserine phosphatase)
MCVVATGISAGEVLSAFHRDAPYLFLGAAFVTVGLLAAALAALRRKPDALLIYFALFAAFYGARLWIQSDLLRMAVQGSLFYARLRFSIDFVVPIPAVLFFEASGLLSRTGRVGGYIWAAVSAGLAVATVVHGPSDLFYLINNVIVITALTALIVRSMIGGRQSRDFVIIRRGLVIFGASALWANVVGIFSIHSPKIEPFGFAVFLGTLGYVVARRTLQRDQELSVIQKELEVARRMQLSILPGDFPRSANFRVAARYVPMTSVAGDFYDFIVADDKQAGLLIADVSGHGVPAALIASMVKLAATSQRANADNPSALLAGMNAALFGNTQNQFVTAAYVHMNSEKGEFRYSAAGHPPMLLLRKGKITEIAENGLMLAAFDFAQYSNASHQLEAGDRILLYTDGIVEAANPSGEFLGHEALCELLQRTAVLQPAEAASRIMSSVQRWSATQDDDLTVLICDYQGVA